VSLACAAGAGELGRSAAGGSQVELAQYTADAICRSMGLEAFVPEGLPCVRILLKPSFHPEVCVTVTEAADPTRARLSVIALTEMLWRQPVPSRLTELREELGVPAEVLAEAAAGFAAAFADRSRDERRVCLDGMGVDCCRLALERVEQFAEHVYRPAVSGFVGRLVWRAWGACQVPGVRNALAECARYLGAEYPRQPDAKRPPARRILVLGTPEAWADYFAALRARRGPAEPGAAADPGHGPHFV
jgi:hypothetical protein